MFRIAETLPFLFLILIPFLIYINRHSLIQASSWRRFITLLFRIIAVLCIIFALAGIQVQRKSNLLSTVFVLDLSDSVLYKSKENAVDEINRIVEQLEEQDKYGLVVFATDAYVKIPLTLKEKKTKVNPDVLDVEGIDTTYTNIAKALQLSLDMFSDPKYQRRIVIFSDGNQNSGDVRNLLEIVRASETEIFTVPLESEREPEIIVEGLEAPDEVRIGGSFRLRGIINSTDATEAKLRLYRDDVFVESREVSISPGRQIVDFSQTLDLRDESTAKDIYKYKLMVESSEDSIAANNTAYQTVKVKGKSRILLVQSKSQGRERLKKLLEQNQLSVTLIDVKRIPENIQELNVYDCLILNNLHADEIGNDRVKAVENYVRDSGKGLVVIGGNQSFGMGNYLDTPLEQCLPVEMTPRQKKGVLALILLIDKSGSMANYIAGIQKIQLAKAAAKSAIKTLDEEDFVGVFTFDAKTRQRVKLTKAKEKENLIKEVGEITAGSGTKMYPALEKAYQQLAEVDAKHKLVIILSDGISEGDFVPLAKKMAQERISISAIAIGDAALELMKSIAEAGKGRYFHVTNVSQLPRIVTEEVHQTQDLIVEREFYPEIIMQHPILKGINNLPKLYGYVATAKKKSAFGLINSDQDEPILAAWNYGLGQSVAFTSNIETNWAAEWIEWEKYGKFWIQVVNWVLPVSSEDRDFDLYVSNDSGIGRITVQISETGDTSQTSEFKGRVLTPDGKGIQLKFNRIGFNRYESTFDANQLGVYIVTIKSFDKRNSVYTKSLVVPYSPEYSKLKVNTPLLRELVDITNGVFQPQIQTVTRRPERTIQRYINLWKWLIIAAVSLFITELIVRRITLAGRLREVTRKKVSPKVSLSRIRSVVSFWRKTEPTAKTEIISEKSELPLATRLLKVKEQNSEEK